MRGIITALSFNTTRAGAFALVLSVAVSCGYDSRSSTAETSDAAAATRTRSEPPRGDATEPRAPERSSDASAADEAGEHEQQTGSSRDAAAGDAPSEPSPTDASAPSPEADTDAVVAPDAGVSAPDVPTPDAGAAPTSEWRLLGYDEASTYFNAAETKLSKANASQLTVAWRADLGDSVYGAPLQVGSRIFASSTNVVAAFDAASGKEVWRKDLRSYSSLAYADGTLYLNSEKGELVALRADDGSKLWTKRHDAQRSDGMSSPLVLGDVVYIGGSGSNVELTTGMFRGYLAALDRHSGDSIWTAYTVPVEARGAGIWSTASASLATGRAYATTSNNYGRPATDSSDAFVAFDLETGAIEWKNQRLANDIFGGGDGGDGFDHDFGANPVLFETRIGGQPTKVLAAGAKSGIAHAVRESDGGLLWERRLGEGLGDGSLGIHVNTTWSGRHLLMACNGDSGATLYALDGATGDVLWMRELPSRVWGRMSAANGVGFAGVGETLDVFDVDTGESLGVYPSNGGTLAGAITVANGRVAFGEGLLWSSGKQGTTLTVMTVP